MMVVFVISWVIPTPSRLWLWFDETTMAIKDLRHIFQSARLERHCFMEEFFLATKEAPRTIGGSMGFN